jgi:hypothetical protein
MLGVAVGVLFGVCLLTGLLVTGLMNIGYWYGWGFDFINTHYWTAWIVTGALVVHLSAKLPVLRRALSRSQAAAKAPGGIERRRFLTTAGVAAGTLLLVTAGEALTPPRPAAALVLVDELAFDNCYPFHATRADLLRRLGRHREAAAAYQRAAAMAPTGAERDFLRLGGRPAR